MKAFLLDFLRIPKAYCEQLPQRTHLKNAKYLKSVIYVHFSYKEGSAGIYCIFEYFKKIAFNLPLGQNYH